MLQVEGSTRRRFGLMLGAFCLLIFGLMVSGLVQRFGQMTGNTVDDPQYEVNLAKAREHAARVREARKVLSALGREGKWDEAVAHAEAKMKESEGFGLNFLYAEALYRAGRYDKAGKEFEVIIAPFDPVSAANRFAIVRKTDEYRRHCEKLLRDTPVSEVPPHIANNTAWACLTAKEGMEDYTKPVELARKAVAGATDETDRWTYLNTLGVALYRAGQDKEAVERLMEAEKINSDVFNWPFLALAHHRLGNKKEAGIWSDRFRKKMDETYATLNYVQNRHELLMFLREIDEAFAAN